MRTLSILLLIVAGFFSVTVSGCKQLNLFPNWFEDEEEEMSKNVRAALRGEAGHSRLLGDYVRVSDTSVGTIKVHGIGLVDRLDGTGDNPPESPYRDRLLAEMRRYEVQNPEQFLKSSSTALVLVTAYIRPTIRKGQLVDVTVSLPPGSAVTSLAGGYLMPCRLSEHAYLGGQNREGKELIIATGPLLLNGLSLEGTTTEEGVLKATIPGGGKYIGDHRDLKIGIRNEYRTVRMSSTIASRIGSRFYDYDDGGIQRPLAKALTNVEIELIVHSRYRDNYWRYLNVIRHISLSENDVQRHMRLKRLEEEIQAGQTAERAALELEAIGNDGIPLLRGGLKSESLEARFRAAEALAYMGYADGVAALKEAADKEPAFRMYALAALSNLDNGKAFDALRELMNHESVETRYGAFRALSTVAPADPSIAGVKMEGAFSIHLVDSTSEPLIHLTRSQKAEVVMFGASQKFQLPLFLRAGTRIMIQNNTRSDGIVLTRIAPGEQIQKREVSTEISQVIKAASGMGASYPDIVQMLIQAERQGNLPGLIAIDELPQGGRMYQRPDATAVAANGKGSSGSSVMVGSEATAPAIFEEKLPQPMESSELTPVAPPTSEDKTIR